MGKGGGGGGRTPVEAKESGRSKQLVKIVEIISEGEIEGLADGMKSVYLDNTPVQNADNSYNFQNVALEGRVGSQVQEIIAGFNTSEKEVSVSTQVRKTTPITRTITDAKVSRLRLTLGVQSLFKQEENGDTNGTNVSLAVFIGNKRYPITISGKYSSQYLQQHTFSDLPKPPFTVRVERVTDDSKSQRLQNNTVWASYTEIIDTEFTYPNTALIGVKFDSEYFSAIPNRTYDVKGLKVKVPTNYNPETRQYTGMWDGTFKTAWTDNPAWALYDIVTNKRYGLGQRLGEFGADKWALYQVAQYCDQLVPDGFGGKEPRFTCNVWLTEQRSAYDVINDICSIFRAMPVWNGRELTVVMDRPSDPVWTYTNANVENGEFTYTFSAKKARHNAIQVEYADKDNAYEKSIEYVSDDAAIRANGLNVKKVTAFGCTSRGQAHRTGLWLLQTEKLETKTVTFTVGAEGLMHVPGDIIKVADVDYAGTNIGGRVLKIAGKKVTLDREISITANSYLTYINAQAKHQDIKILSVNGTEVTLDREPTGLAEYGVWSLTTQQINAQLFRALTVTEEDKGKYTIVALQHEPQKEAIVDNGAKFEPKATSVLSVPKVNDIQLVVNADGSIAINADVSGGNGLVQYDILIYKGDKLFDTRLGLKSPELDLSGLENGEYLVLIRAKNEKGQLLNERTQTFTIDRPPAPTGVRATGGLGNITLEWDWVNDATQTEIWVSEQNNLALAKRLVKLTAKMYSHEVGAKQVRYYWLRHIRGVNVGAFSQQSGLRGESSVDIDQELSLLNQKLSQNIIDKVFDVAAPARKLEMIKTVAKLNVKQFEGVKQVHNEADGKLYTWNGREYTAKVQAVDLDGKIAKSQLDSTMLNELTQTKNTANNANTKANQLQNALNNEVAQRTQAIAAESANLTAKIQAEANTRGTAITQLQNTNKQQAQQITTLTAKADNALSGLEAEKTARANGDKAEAKARETLTTRLGQAEATLNTVQTTKASKTEVASIAQTALQATWKADAKAEVDKVQVGGRNYLLDSLFNQRKWHTSQGNAETRATFHIENGEVTISSTNTTWKQYQLSGYNFEGGMNLLNDGAKVTLSFEVMTPDENPNGDIKYWANLRADRNNGEASTNPVVIAQTPAPNKWTKVSVTGTATQPSDLKGWRLILGVSTAGTVKFRKPKLELGTISTDWTPAPEDVEGDIAKVSANLTAYQATQATKDKAEAEKLSALTTRVGAAEGKITHAEKSISTLNSSTATKFSQLEANLNNAKSDLGAKITAEQTARANGDKAQADELKKLTASVNNTTAQISTVSKAVADVNGKLTATHTIKTQIIAGNRTVIAGISLGANKEQSSVIVMADKFQVVKNAQDNAPKSMLAVVNNQVAINGDLIANGQISAQKLATNAVTAAAIQTGAIRANHLQAGEISADKLAIGLGGNLLVNPIFANPTAGVPYDWIERGSLVLSEHHATADPDYGLHKAYLPNENIIRWSSVGKNPTVWKQIGAEVPLNPAAWYMVSAYTGNHRCDVKMVVQFLDENKAEVSVFVVSANKPNQEYAFGDLHSANRVQFKRQAPNNARFMRVYFRKYGTWTTANRNDSYMFVARPMVEECTEHTREPSSWQNAGVTAIHGGSIVTKSITAQQIAAGAITANEIAAGAIAARHIATNTISAKHIAAKSITSDQLSVSSLSAISSNLGDITGGSLNINNRFKVNNEGLVEMRAAAGNVGLVINNNQIIVYDKHGNIRVKIGLL